MDKLDGSNSSDGNDQIIEMIKSKFDREAREEILRKLFIYLTTRDIIICVGQGFSNFPKSILQMI